MLIAGLIALSWTTMMPYASNLLNQEPRAGVLLGVTYRHYTERQKQ